MSSRIWRRIASVSLLLLGTTLASGGALAQARQKTDSRIVYEVTPRPEAMPPRVDVLMRIPQEESEETLVVQMPVWSPGDYHVQDHGKYVQSLQAWAGEAGKSESLPIEHPQSHTWRIRTQKAKSVTLSYSLPQTPRGFFSENVWFGEEQVFLNGPAVYLYVAGRKETPARLVLRLPKAWIAYTALAEAKETKPDAPEYLAPDYDTLADSPLAMGSPERVRLEKFVVKEKPHTVVFFNDSKAIADPKAYPPLLSRIILAYDRIMGGLPYDRYAFFFDVNGRGGGLEHLNGTRIAIGPSDPRFISHLAAHEFFHLWNVKRIRPKVLGPFDYINPPRTRNLWFAEGVTDYYASICLLRAGLTSAPRFLQNFGGAINAYNSAPGRLRVSADESSLKVWEAGNSSGFGFSYYFRGMLIGLCLDLKIRHETQNRRSLDDVLRELMRRGGLPKPGYEEDEIRDTVNQIAGKNLTAFYDRVARSVEEMPFAECLGYAGLSLQMEPLPDATAAQIAIRKAWLRTFGDVAPQSRAPFLQNATWKRGYAHAR